MPKPRSLNMLPFLLLFLASAPAAATEAAVAPAVAQLGPALEIRLDGPVLRLTGAGDELFAARLIEHSPVTGQDLDAAPTVQARSWNYAHLQGIAFLDLAAAADAPFIPGLEIEDADGFEFRSQLFHPHDGTGGDARRTLDYWVRQIETGAGREWIAVVRLDGQKAQQRDGNSFSFGELTDSNTGHWPMAIVRARSSGELTFRIEQASMAFDGAGTRTDPATWWRVPALCGLCQQQGVSEVELDLQDRGSSVMVRTHARRRYADHVGTAPEGILIEGQPLAPFLSGEQGDDAWFSVPFDTPMADVLVAVARRGDARIEVRLGTGEMREAPTVHVKLDPAFEARLYADGDRPSPDFDWPQHLSSSLVSAWPNPFRTSTSIEVDVPATIEEAFDLEPDLLARVQPGAEPPFGRNPTVSVKVYNVGGQLVATLDQGPRTPGRFTVDWDGQDLQSRPVASGAYYVHVEMEEWSVTRRVLLLRN